MTTVGYGDHSPGSHIGQFICGISMLMGIMVLALPLNIIGQSASRPPPCLVCVAALANHAPWALTRVPCPLLRCGICSGMAFEETGKEQHIYEQERAARLAEERKKVVGDKSSPRAFHAKVRTAAGRNRFSRVGPAL